MININKLNLLGRVVLLLVLLVTVNALLMHIEKNSGQVRIEGPFHIRDSKGTNEVYDSYKDYSFGKMKRGDWIEVSAIMPKSQQLDNSISVEVDFTMVELIVDGEKVYSNVDNLKDARYVSNSYHIPANDDWYNKEITFKYTAADSIKQTEIPLMYYGELNSVYIYSVKKNMIIAALAAIFVFAGVVVLIFEVCTREFTRDRIKLIILSVLSVFGAIWILALINVLALTNLPSKLLYYLEYISAYGTGVTSTLYIVHLDEFRKRHRRKITIFALVQVVIAVISFMLDFIGMVSLHGMIKYYHLLLIIGILFIAFIVVLTSIKEKEHKKGFEIFVVGAVVLLVLEILRYYVFSKDSFSVGNAIPYILVAMIVVFICKYAYDLIGIYSNQVQISFLESLAYKDALTGIANRNMCEKKFNDINSLSVGMFRIIMFDVNGLKYVNDTFGHSYGDELIVNFAKALKVVFNKDGVFVGRMGGDEFVVIIDESNMDDEEEMLNNLKKYTQHINETNSNKYDIKYSYGVAFCDRTRNNDVWKKYSQADSNMYIMKGN